MDKKDLALPQQEMANALYHDLFNKIKVAKEEADHEKKPLVVLIGESHTDKGAGLIEIMAIDICHRLGMKNVLLERDAKSSGVVNEARSFVRGAIQLHPSMAKLDLPHNGNNIAAVAARIKTLHNDPRWKEKVEALQNYHYNLDALLAKDMNCLPGDPNYTQRHQKKLDLIKKGGQMFWQYQFDPEEAKREDEAIAATIHDATKAGDCISIGGHFHLPNIKHSLEEQGAKVLALNTKAINITPEVRQQTAVGFRIGLLEPLQDIEVFSIPSDQVIDPVDSLRLMIEASLTHQINTGNQQAASQLNSLRQCISAGRGK